MKLNRYIALILTLAAAATGLTSCNDDPKEPEIRLFTDIVTVVKADAGETVLTFRRQDDSPLITLTSTQTMDAQIFKPGQRIVMNYYNATSEQYVSGPIKIYAAAPTVGSGAAVPDSLASKTQNWATAPITVSGIWRSGEYVNLIFQAVTGTDARTCALVADRETLDDEYPQLHLIFKPNDQFDVQNYLIYMSYSLSDIFAHPNVKGVQIHYRQDQGYGMTQLDKMTSTFTPVS